MKGPPGLLLYRCELRCAWITEPTCAALRAKPEASKDRRYPAATFHTATPCAGCPGVVELRARRVTPAPRRLET